MSIFSLQPIYQERIWGGRALEETLGRTLPPESKIGEAWELCDRPEAQSLIVETGQTLHDLWTAPGHAKIFGTRAPKTERFPILIKILDAREDLSLQVHPPAALAPKFKGEPKTEMWYFLETAEDAAIYVGLKKGMTRKKFEEALANKTSASCFHKLQTAPGEAMFLPSGRVHAIGGGNLILEIQQNSDTTFRVYDWDRVDAKTGKPRELHIQESLECINFSDYEPFFVQPHGSTVLRCDLFQIHRHNLFEKETRDFAGDPKSIQYFFVSLGKIKIGETEYPRGSSLLITADHDFLEVQALEDQVEIITVTFP